MQLKNLIKTIDAKHIKNFKNHNIKNITHISQDCTKGSIFICLNGENFDGNDFIQKAISKGAKCIITEREDIVDCDATIVVVENARIAMSRLAKIFYNNVCDKLDIVGVIGTSGKTTTCHIISNILSINDKNIGNIGTNGIYIGNNRLANKFTTPDPLELHYIFYQMYLLGVKTVVMEVSAQAIMLYKMYGIKLKIGVFTNLSNEHLDFFKTMENYARVKMNYFNKDNMEECVVNIDDFYGRELAYKVQIPCVSYGINSPANSFAVDIDSSLQGLEFVANIMDSVFRINVDLKGAYNVYNLISGMTVCKMLGMSDEDIEKGVASISQIDGRFNVWDKGSKKIIVDFAHTPDSIEKLLSNISGFSQGKLISIFGCVGYSDRDKRIDMTSVVDRYSDYIIMTSDNPGTTPFRDIISDMECGVNKCQYVCIEDRKMAIEFGYNMLQDNDILVIIGKGAEDFQKIGGERIPYSDIGVVKELLNKG